MVNWEQINTLFSLRRSDRKPIIIAGVGSGLTAKAAVAGGADFLATYNTAQYRIQGIPTGLAFLPYDNCNELAFRLAPEVIAAAGKTPVILGLGAHDPRMPINYLLDKVVEEGIKGITNEPFIGIYGKELKNYLDGIGFGLNKEIELINEASKRKLLTLAYVFDAEEARQYVNVGATIISAMIGGVTSGGDAGGNNTLTLDDAIKKINNIVDAVRKENSNIPVLAHGGPLNDVNSVSYMLNQTDADGYVTGSTGERIPVELSVKTRIEEYKQIQRAKYK